MKQYPTLEQWQEIIEKLPTKLILLHPSVSRTDLLEALSKYPQLNLSLHWFPATPRFGEELSLASRIEMLETDLTKGMVVICNSLIDIVNLCRTKQLPFILAYSTHRGATERGRREGHSEESTRFWHHCTNEYNTITDRTVIKVAAGPDDIFSSVIDLARHAPK